MQNLDSKVRDILVENGLDFTIEKRPLVALVDGFGGIDADGNLLTEKVEIETPFYGLFNSKSGKCINSVKKGYHVSQNADIVELILRGIEGFGTQLKVSKAGSINDGRRVYLQLEIEGIAKVGDDVVKKYVTIIDSNDGSTGLSVGIGDFTMSCENQFFKFYKSGQSKMRHTASLETRMLEIPSLIGLALEESMRNIETYQVMARHAVTNNDVNNLVSHLVDLSYNNSYFELEEASKKKVNIMNTLYDMIRVEMAQKGKTAWGLHSGVTRWTTHTKQAPNRLNGRIESALLGTNYKTNQKSFEFVKQIVGVE